MAGLSASAPITPAISATTHPQPSPAISRGAGASRNTAAAVKVGMPAAAKIKAEASPASTAITIQLLIISAVPRPVGGLEAARPPPQPEPSGRILAPPKARRGMVYLIT